MADVDFSDLESAERWFEGQSVETRCVITSRAALRVVANVDLIADAHKQSVALMSLRAVLVSEARGLCKHADVKDLEKAVRSTADSAANLAAQSAFSSTRSAHFIARSTARSAARLGTRSAAEFVSLTGLSTDRAAALSAAQYDATQVIDQLVQQAVWAGAEVPKAIAENHAAFLTYLDSHDDWRFWLRWYLGMWEGTFTDCDLAIEVAKIPDEVWKAGLSAVAGAIREIEARLLIERLPLNETITLNADTGRFFGTPVEISNPALLGATLDQVRDALEDVLEDENNGLQERDLEVRKLRRMMDRRSNDPQNVEMTCTSIGRSLTLKIAGPDAELPPSDENVELINALREAAQGLRASHPEIEENRRILSEQAFKELPDAARAELADAQPVLEAITESYIHDDLAEDIPFLLSDDMRVGRPRLGGAERNPVLAGYDEMQRTFGRVARIALILRKTPDLVHKIDGSAGYKAARIVTTVAALVAIGIALI